MSFGIHRRRRWRPLQRERPNLRMLGAAERATLSSQMHTPLAGWQSGHAAACKAAYAGSIPTSASNCKPRFGGAFLFDRFRSLSHRARIRHHASRAWVAKPVYARDLKSLGGNPMRVQVPPQAPHHYSASLRAFHAGRRSMDGDRQFSEREILPDHRPALSAAVRASVIATAMLSEMERSSGK